MSECPAHETAPDQDTPCPNGEHCWNPDCKSPSADIAPRVSERLHACPGISVCEPHVAEPVRKFRCGPDARTCTCLADALRFIRTVEWAEIDDCRPRIGLYAVDATTGTELTQRGSRAPTGKPFPLDNFERRAAALRASPRVTEDDIERVRVIAADADAIQDTLDRVREKYGLDDTDEPTDIEEASE